MATNADQKHTVFISYSHKDEHWKDRLRAHLGALEQAGRVVVWDDRKIDPGGEWFEEIKEIMDRAAVTLCLITPSYLSSNFCVKIEVPYLLERQRNAGMFLMPILILPCVWEVFEWLEARQIVPRDGKSVAVDYKDKEDGVFADVVRHIRRIFEDPAYRPAPPPTVYAPPEKITIERLPVTGAELYGRQTELKQLDRDWESGTTNVVSLVAWGGVGKSTLVDKWRERMAADNYRGARRVYAWSFYSQGVGERATSADQFITDALEWFGDPEPARADSPWGKGERLARLVREQKTLLLLDGLEPLQSSFTDEYGKIKDPALATLVTELAQENNGLCVITTRVRVPELVPHTETTRQENLEQISTEAGRALLRLGGVRGTDAELESASQDFGNHALALNLLAVYLHEIPGHHISEAARIPALGLSEASGEHPRRVMAAFERRLGDGPEVELLRMLGLFDRPADKEAIDALRAAPPIPGLTGHVQQLSEAAWLRLISRLRRLRLIAQESQHQLDALDAHPLVREHFGEQLRLQHPDAWREGNNRLYEHFKQRAPELPESIPEMEPLFMAVTYGCNAGRHRDALHDVYLPRIMRGKQSYAAKLGARSALLSALTHFVEQGDWGRPVAPDPPHRQGLEPKDQLTVLTQAGLFLTTTRGYASNEAMACYRRVQDLCTQLDETALLYSVSINHWRYSLVTNDLLTTLQLASEVHELAEGQNDPALLVGAFRALGTTSYFNGNFKAALDYTQQGIDIWYSQEQIPTRVEEVTAPIVTCLAIKAMVRWHMGHPDEAREQVSRACDVARELSDMNALAVGLFLNSYINQFCRLPEETLKTTKELIEVCEAQGIVLWLAAGKVLRGWAYAALGDTREGFALMNQGTRNWQQTGAEVSLQYFLWLKAEALGRLGRFKEAHALLVEAEAFANRLNEHWWLAELHRLKAEMLVAENAPADLAEWNYDIALGVARSRGSLAQQLRASISLARLWRAQGKGRQAHVLVSDIYSKFDAGIDNADLQEAKALLDAEQ